MLYFLIPERESPQDSAEQVPQPKDTHKPKDGVKTGENPDTEDKGQEIEDANSKDRLGAGGQAADIWLRKALKSAIRVEKP